MTWARDSVERLRQAWAAAPMLVRTGYVASSIVFAGFWCLVLALTFFIGEELWSVTTLDTVVRVGLVLLSLLAAAWLSSTMPLLPQTTRRRLRSDIMRVGGALLLLLTFFAGYSSFRNQGRLASEGSLSSGGYHLYNLEMTKPAIRCVYLNYGYENAHECLESLVKDADSWTFAIYYVEEAWFQLMQSKKEQDEWGSTYAEQVKYWAQDVSRDPTGIFSYYLISSEGSLEEARETMINSGVNISNPCTRFKDVWRALERKGRLPARVSGAARECARTAPDEQSILGRPLLTTANVR